MIKLNLIPEQKKEEIKRAHQFKTVLKWEIELSGILMVFLAMLLSINYILKFTLSSDVQSGDLQASSQYQEIQKYDAEIRDMNLKVLEIEKIQKSQLSWFNFLQKMNGQFSSSIKMDRIKTNNYAILISGKADNRDSLISFKENMEKDECFSGVDFPLSNLVEKENVEFQIGFTFKQECLR